MRKIIGIGQCGSRLTKEFIEEYKFEGAIVFNSNEKDLEEVIHKDIQKVILYDANNKANGLGADPAVSKKFYEHNAGGIRKALSEFITAGDEIWVAAALGGGTGSGGIIPILGMMKKMNPKRITVVAVISSETDGINKCYNSMVQLYNLFNIACVDNQWANLILLDNGKFPNFQEANKSLVKSMDLILGESREESILPNGDGHADEGDLATVLRAQSGCLMVTSTKLMTNIFLEHEYDQKPVSAWIRYVHPEKDGSGDTQLEEFVNKNPMAGIFRGEYTGRTYRLDIVMAGLNLPRTVLANKRRLIANMNRHKKRKDGDDKAQRMGQLSMDGIKLL